MNIAVNDLIETKKPHPCGGKTWLVLRVGMDFRLRCTTCGRELMIPPCKSRKEHPQGSSASGGMTTHVFSA